MEQRQRYLQESFSAVSIQPFTKEMGEMAARIDGDSRKEGKVIAFADLQIGVTALWFGYEIMSDNLRHFSMIPGLVVKRL
ncbi:MAG: tRNA(fMet)-specific endonuclease VapC [Bryobacterales bacterium]|jgi:predicted nucleic acid-binding protein|nr:tRNA(fMet)-specific endonuclease VapC [Bryobacterales bacterium]